MQVQLSFQQLLTLYGQSQAEGKLLLETVNALEHENKRLKSDLAMLADAATIRNETKSEESAT